jgi:cytochrome c oxidase subunit 4
MSQEHAAATEHKPHVLPHAMYIGVWAALIVLTVITVWVSYHDYGNMNIVVAMAVATVKASLVVLFFMHLKYDEPFNGLIFVGTLIFLGIFIVLTMADFQERGKVNPIRAREIQLVPARPELEAEAREDAGGEGVHGEAATPETEAAPEETPPPPTGTPGH